MKGKFITFEGGEGSGKSSALAYISNRLKEEGIPFVLTREPGGTKISEEIRGIILDKANTEMDPMTEALLYAAARRQHLVQLVYPKLNEGINVISDRFLDSSLAYQGGARGLGIQKIYDLNLYATDGFLPDLTLLFDLDPETGLKRISANENREVNRLDLEKLNFHKTVRENFLKLAQKFPERINIIDASLTPEQVREEAFKAIMDVLK